MPLTRRTRICIAFTIKLSRVNNFLIREDPLSLQDPATMKPGLASPNAFIALQISNPEIHSKVRQFQDKFLINNPKLWQYCRPIARSHITLQVCKLLSTILAAKTFKSIGWEVLLLSRKWSKIKVYFLTTRFSSTLRNTVRMQCRGWWTP